MNIHEHSRSTDTILLQIPFEHYRQGTRFIYIGCCVESRPTPGRNEHEEVQSVCVFGHPSPSCFEPHPTLDPSPPWVLEFLFGRVVRLDCQTTILRAT